MKIWLARMLLTALVFALTPTPAAGNTPLAPLPSTIRVNVSLLGTTYAKIGSTGSLTVTREDGGKVYQGFAYTVARRGVRRLADPSHALAGVKDPGERRSLLQLFREAHLRAQVEDIPIMTVPFEFALEGDGSDPLSAPLFSAQQITTLHYVASGGLLTFNGRAYRGTLDITRDDEGDMIVVNEVDTASYLASVIGSEEPTTWMPEALAAQAIAARTYLSRHLRKHDNYDLEGDTRDQEYDGIAGEAESTVKAVQRTAGMIATYRGAAIEALYSANAGGVTEDSESVFANALPYLRSVPSPGDEIAKNSSFGRTSWEWDREFTAPLLADYMRLRGLDVGTPTKIEVLGKTAAGRPLLTRVTGTTGSKELTMERARYYFGLKSNFFTPVQLPAQTEWVSPRDTARLRDMDVLGATRVSQNWDFTFDETGRRKGIVVTEILYQLPARFDFVGKGFGHSVGMSQWGAQGMALGGANYEQILKHYYTGIQLTNVGGA